MNDELLPAIGFLFVASILVTGYVALGPGSCSNLALVNLDFSDYLRAELEEQYLLDAANEASSEQVSSTQLLRPKAAGGGGWFRPEGWTVYDYEQRQRSNGSMEARALRRRQAYQIWELDIFYQAVDPSTGIFTEEALKEIKDFEDQLVSFDGYGGFCRRPNASLHNGSTMAYDGSGTLADIVPVSAQKAPRKVRVELSLAEESVLKELVDNEWTDGDFNRNNLKYSRATLYGGFLFASFMQALHYAHGALPDLVKEAKINAWLGRLFEEFLRRADLTGNDALPYKHVKFTWYEKRILYYLRFDTLFALGTMATVALLVLARIQNLFITFFGAIGPRLTWPRFKALSILDFVSLFVILGIAADDVLLLFNTYSLAAVLLGAEATPQQKMRWAYKEGTAPTVTTCGSFYANCFSIVTVVRSFGFFMATLVAWNFLNASSLVQRVPSRAVKFLHEVLIIFPAAILVNDLYIIPLLTCRRDHIAQAYANERAMQWLCTSVPCLHTSACNPRMCGAVVLALSQSQSQSQSFADKSAEKEDLGLVERVVAKRFSPCLHHSRCLLILLSIVAAAVFCYLATVAFHVSEGQIKIFEEDLNLGRLEELRKESMKLCEVFPASSDEDFKEALEGQGAFEAVPVFDRAIDVRSCPGRTVGDGNTSWCSGQGTCDATSSTCDDGFVGQACSVTRSSGTLDLVYLSIAQALQLLCFRDLLFFLPFFKDPDEYLYAHVLSSPELLAAPESLPAGRGDFFLRPPGPAWNQGDEDVDWQLDAVAPAWLSLEPTGGVLRKRSFSRTDDSFAGRSSFQAAFDLAGSLPLTPAERGTPPQNEVYFTDSAEWKQRRVEQKAEYRARPKVERRQGTWTKDKPKYAEKYRRPRPIDRPPKHSIETDPVHFVDYRKTSGWSEQMELRLLATTPSASLPPRGLRLTAAVASPPALGALKAFAEGEEVFLQPAFDVSRTDASENFVARNLEIRYQVFSRSDWLRVDLEALGPDSVLVSGRPLRGTSLVISSFSRQTTTYFLEAFRSCDGPCPTETSTTATTTRITSTLLPGVSTTTTTYTTTQTQDTDHVVGLMALTALNCPALRSQEGAETSWQVSVQSDLTSFVSRLGGDLEVEEAVVSVSVWCDGQLQVSPVELLYSMASVVVGGGIATADVVRRLELESPETMTQKLQASLDADGFPVVLEVLSLEAIQDPTTTARASESLPLCRALRESLLRALLRGDEQHLDLHVLHGDSNGNDKHRNDHFGHGERYKLADPHGNFKHQQQHHENPKHGHQLHFDKQHQQ
ncbi:Patched domain-containing protein 2 [Symbiodinium microadriaticum]|uniref:Patched domain-containing protein 2 n=1 Tax=Symbiodinium microadriaticum TaxID=2951 RepID=A0A1Q9DNL8_SYMMI|nr:Patched domain-containing protein 2 [Symbiodinium microadriaticum]